MKTSILTILFVCICVTSGYRIKSADYFIEYISKDGKGDTTEQTVRIEQQEVRFTVMHDMVAILDYSQMLLFARRSDEKHCIATSFKDMKQIPSLESISAILNKDKEQFKMPWPARSQKLYLQKSQQQQRPELSPLTEELCGKYEIIMMQTKPVKTSGSSLETAVALRHKLRPKREVGWGEIILIVIVVIILL